MEQQKLKSKNQYSSSILKFRLKKKVLNNGAVYSITNRKIQSLDYQAEEFRKARSMDIIGFNNVQQRKDYRGVQRQEIQENHDEDANDNQDMESLFAGSSQTSISGIFEEDTENHYQTSVTACTVIKEPEQLIDKDLINLLSFIKKLPIPPESDLKGRYVEFGEFTRHKTLIWDMDETLIHAQLLIPNQDFMDLSDFTVTLKNGTKFAVTIRPYMAKCLEHLSQFYEMAVFTAADQEYAEMILEKIDPEKKFFSHRMFRQHCVRAEDAYVKDLRIISDRDLEDIVIVDNSIVSFAFQLSNGIPICAFYSMNKHQDQEMLYLLVYLEEVYYNQKDVRDANKTTFKLQESRIKVKNQYTSSILKFKLNQKIQHNVAVAALTQNKIPQLDLLAEDIRQSKTKSMMFIESPDVKLKHRTHQQNEQKKQEQQRPFKTTVLSPGTTDPGLNPQAQQVIEAYIVGDSVSSMSSILDEDTEDYYSQSIIVSSMVKEPEDLIDKDLLNLLAFIKRLSEPTEAQIMEKSLEFGEISRHKTLIFDLDETLIHSQQITGNSDHEIVKDFEITLAKNVRFGVAVRPYVQQCLDHLSNYYEMAVFTAAEQTYADLIIDKIDPEKKYFSHRLYRQHCFKIDDVYIKDLRIISDRPTEDTIIVDNSILSFAFQLDNGVPMCAFMASNNQDSELLYLITYLEEVYHLKDCRTANKKTFKLSEMMTKIN